jgi:hypothetical protein
MRREERSEPRHKIIIQKISRGWTSRQMLKVGSNLPVEGLEGFYFYPKVAFLESEQGYSDARVRRWDYHRWVRVELETHLEHRMVVVSADLRWEMFLMWVLARSYCR